MQEKTERLPTHEECMALLDEHEVPEHIRKHSFAVNKASVFLAKKLKGSGIDIDVELVDRASLLHDIDKLPTLENGQHGIMAKNILTEKGYVKIGEVIHKHLFHSILDNGLKTWEEKILNYADKRCQEDEIVTLDHRFAYGRKRYKDHEDPRTGEAEDLFRQLEKEIFKKIDLNPERLGEYIEE